MRKVQGHSRDSIQFFCLDEMIPHDSFFRVVDAFIDTIDLEKLGFKYKKRKSNAGRPAYSARSLLKLFICGYRLSIRSGRKLEDVCKYDIRFKWLLNSTTPDANTINDFRKNNTSLLKNVFYELNRNLLKMNLLSLSSLSQDGYKIKASNSKENNYTRNKVNDRIIRNNDKKEKLSKILDEVKKFEQYLTDSEKLSILEESENELNDVNQRLAKQNAISDYLNASGENQISLTDPDCKLMRNNSKFEPCYNNQATVDTSSHLTAAFNADDNPADIGSLNNMADIINKEYKQHDDVIENIENPITTIPTDKGYLSTKDMMDCLENAVIPQVTPINKGQTHYNLETVYEKHDITEDIFNSTKPEDIKKCLRSGVVPKCYEDMVFDIKVEEKKVFVEDKDDLIIEHRSEEEIRETAIENSTFERDLRTNTVFCPAGEILSQKSTNGDLTRYTNKLACKNCKNKCTPSKFKEANFKKNQKTMVPKNSTAEKPRNKRRKKTTRSIVTLKLKIDYNILKLRMQTSEHSQGTLKTVDNHSYLNVRGKDLVNADLSIHYTFSNLRRACNMVGAEKLIEMFLELSLLSKKIKNSILIFYFRINFSFLLLF